MTIRTYLGAKRYNNRMDKIWATYKAQEAKKDACPHSIKLTTHYGYQCPECYKSFNHNLKPLK